MNHDQLMNDGTPEATGMNPIGTQRENSPHGGQRRRHTNRGLKKVFDYFFARRSTANRIRPIVLALVGIIAAWFLVMWTLNHVLLEWPTGFGDSAARPTIQIR